MKITIAPYSPAWPRMFEEQEQVIAKAIGHLGARIDHIGSTSVPGLAAKPVIDILVGVTSEADLQKVIKPMMAAGYTYFQLYEESMPYRRFFVKLKPLQGDAAPEAVFPDTLYDRTRFENQVNIHIIPQDSPHWLRHIALRDYLRAHPDARDEYGAHKLAIAQQEFENVFAYNDAKDELVKRLESEAVKWYERGSR